MITEYETHGNLNPKIWVDDKLRNDLRKGFLKIARNFYEFLEISVPIQDIILIGSNANYNWTKYSDIDIHIIVNYLEIGDNLHLVQNYLHAKKSVWNSNHPLTFKGMNIELYAQDSNDNLHASVGIYSILNDKWIQKPNSKIISIDDDIITQKTKSYEYEIDALSEKDTKLEFKIKDILLRLHNLRRSGLEAEGEYSLENLAYKHLRNTGYIERLKKLLQNSTMGRLSIEVPINENNNLQKSAKNRLVDTGKTQIKKFMLAMKNEGVETKQAFKLLMQHVSGKKLDDADWKFIKMQMKDVVKMIGLTTVAIAPGGTLVALLARALKVDKYMLPSSFKTEKEVTESLIMHVTNKQTLDDAGWNHVIKHTQGVEDPAGQWKHPGKCTMIPGNQITMKMVPHHVLGIDDLGTMKLMKPEQTYTYPGSKVFEIPVTPQWKTIIMQLRNAIQNGSKYGN